MRLRTVLARTLVATLSLAASAYQSFAAPIGSTDFAVLRLGNGAAALPTNNSASTSAYLDVYNLNTGSLSQSIQLDGNNFSYTNGGNRDGIFQLSQDGQTYSIGGYNAPAGTANPITSTGRTIAQVTLATGGVDYSTQFAGNGNPIRAVASNDGSQLWFSTDGTGGTAVNYVPFGGGAVTSVSNDSSRAVNVANNQLYTMSGSSGFRGIGAISGGLPTSGPTTTTYFTPAPNPGSGPGVSSMFYADANTIYATGSSNPNTPGADDFREYHFESGSWVLKAAIASPDGAASAFGIFSIPDPAIPGNYLVYMSTFSHIYKVSDNPTDASFPAISNATAFVTVGANEAFRGIAPTPVPEPSTFVLAGLGILGALVARYRHRAA